MLRLSETFREVFHNIWQLGHFHTQSTFHWDVFHGQAALTLRILALMKLLLMIADKCSLNIVKYC